MKNTVIFFLFSAVISLLPIYTQAHGIPTKYRTEIQKILSETEQIESLPPLPDERLMAWRFKEEGKYLLSEMQYHEVTMIHDLFEYCDHLTMENGNVPTAEAQTIRSAARKRLLHLLEVMPNAITVNITEEGARFDPDQLIHFESDAGLVFLKIVDGTNVSSMLTLPFSRTTWNIASIPEPESNFQVPYQPGNTTWIMLRVSNIPPSQAVLYLDLVGMGIPFNQDNRMYIKLQAGKRGFLRLNVVENGETTPAMVRLLNLSNSSLHRPAGAVEFSSQMDYISGDPTPSPARTTPGTDQAYPYSIPGKFGGHYWVVNEPSYQKLGVGKWRAYVWKGPEYKGVIQEFEIKEGQDTDLTFTLERWINMAEKGWHSGDVHIHSRMMSDQDAERLHIWMEACDLRLGNVVTMGNYLRTFFEQRGFGKEFRVEHNNRFLVPGQEDPRFLDGHSLTINADRLIRDMAHYGSNEWVARQAHEAGGLYGHAHMTYNGFDVRRDLTMLMPLGLSDFGEVMQVGELETSLYYDFLNLGFPLTGVAGSDVPFGHGMGEVRHYVYTGNPVLDPDVWFDQLQKGRAFVSNGPMLEFTVNGKLPGEHLDFENNEKLLIKANSKTWLGYEGGLQSLQIISQGKVIHEVKAVSDSTEELELEFSIPVNNGMWIAAKTSTQNGYKAHTTPVYITRNGMRFWDHDQVPELINKCFDTLARMENEMNRIEEMQKSEDYDYWNFFNRSVMYAIPDRRERIQRTKEYYEKLISEWESEGEKRE